MDGAATDLMTGDRPAAARAVAEAVGIEVVHAELLPEGKAAWMASENRTVAFIGDGINDAPALAQADAQEHRPPVGAMAEWVKRSNTGRPTPV